MEGHVRTSYVGAGVTVIHCTELGGTTPGSEDRCATCWDSCFQSRGGVVSVLSILCTDSERCQHPHGFCFDCDMSRNISQGLREAMKSGGASSTAFGIGGAGDPDEEEVGSQAGGFHDGSGEKTGDAADVGDEGNGGAAGASGAVGMSGVLGEGARLLRVQEVAILAQQRRDAPRGLARHARSRGAAL